MKNLGVETTHAETWWLQCSCTSRTPVCCIPKQLVCPSNWLPIVSRYFFRPWQRNICGCMLMWNLFDSSWQSQEQVSQSRHAPCNQPFLASIQIVVHLYSRTQNQPVNSINLCVGNQISFHAHCMLCFTDEITIDNVSDVIRIDWLFCVGSRSLGTTDPSCA